MSELAYHDFRSFIDEAKKISDHRIIENADWDGEIGALVESTAELVPQPPMLIFDKVKGYPAGYRVCSLPYAAYRRVALALGLPTDKPKLEILRLAARKVKTAEPVPPKEVSTSPLFENRFTGGDVNLLKFPALRFHENDGGRYFGPGGGLINQDPESGYVNTGHTSLRHFAMRGRSPKYSQDRFRTKLHEMIPIDEEPPDIHPKFLEELKRNGVKSEISVVEE